MSDTLALTSFDGEDEVFVFPASYAQQRLWFLDQFDPGSPFYNIPSAIRLYGRLDVSVLERALNEIVARHEALRTTLSTIDGQPVQVIHPELVLHIPVVDLREHPEAMRMDEAMRLANEEARQPFDLAHGPLLRVKLLQLAEQDHIALMTMHHIVSDGWSMGVLIYELSTLFAAFTSGYPSPLPELAIQYADYSEWQRGWLTGEVLEEQISYWKQRLGNNPPVLELPSDHPRPAVLTSRGADTSVVIPRALMDRLKSLTQQEGATLFMTLLTAFQVLLYRYTGQEDICVGAPIANRNRAELEALIGVFINTIVVRTDLSGEPTFRELLHRVREVTLEAYAHQDVPFEVVVDQLQIERDMSHNPLFQVMFILQNAPTHGTDLPGIRMESLDVHSGTSTFDITFSLSDGREGLHASVEYNIDLFEKATIERMLAHWQIILEAAAENPDQSIALLPLLTVEEQNQLLINWNKTFDDFRESEFGDVDRRQLLVHELVAQQAQRVPDQVAVVIPAINNQPRTQITYSELDQRSDILATYLLHLGVVPNTVVGVCFDRSSDTQMAMITSLLGILKAGGAYLPLDPFAPQDRLAFILDDAGHLMPGQVPLVLTQAHLADRFSDSIRLIKVDKDWDQILKQNERIEVQYIRPAQQDLVYMTYTSGSTGQAKGVMVEHQSLVNQYLAWEKDYTLDKVFSHLQMANFTFDVFSGDLVRGLCSGGKLVLSPREWLLAPEKLYPLMLEEQIDIAEFVPAVLRNLIAYLEKTGGRLDFMKLLICGSDAWYVGEYRKFSQFIAPTTRLINSFGLTETTIDSTYFEGSTQHLSPDQLVPIGKAFANTRLYILDRHLQLCPVLVPGELFIGGPGVARGYNNRSELNIEKFIQNPFSSEPDRLYRTGDMARYLPDGNVEFLGRMDDQLKIRGLRIEPGEIEALLGAHPGIKEAAVAALEVTKDDKRLVAYVVPDPSLEKPTTGALRRYLQERLPDYMVPSAFVSLDSLPLNASGKVDRRALAETHHPDWSERTLANAYVAPRTPIEEMLVDVWSQILGVQKIGIYDNFFELGGHSLLATQLVSRVREVFNIDLPLRNLFESPTINRLAEQIEVMEYAQTKEFPVPALIPLPRNPLTGLPNDPVPLSFAQQRLWFLDQLEPDSPFYNLPEAIRLIGDLDEQILLNSLNLLVERHEALRTTFHTINGTPVQVITALADLEPVQLLRLDISHLPEDEREQEVLRITQEEAQRPFNLSAGPLFRASLVRLAEKETLVLLTMHHIIGDNWSSNVLVGEMVTLYDSLAKQRPNPLPPLPIQYPDFTAWQRQWLQGDVLEKQLSYWKNELSGLPPLLELPTDRPRPPMQTFDGDFRSFKLSPDLTRKLRELSQIENATLFMTLLSAFEVLLYRYSGQEDMAIGTPIANRTRSELEGLIGFFVNTLVLRANLEGEPSFRKLLSNVRQGALSAYAHQDVPFEMVVDALQPERNLSHSPLFQVMFVLQASQSSTLGMPDLNLQVHSVESHSGTAKFDLTLFMAEDVGQLGGALEYNTDLFDDATIEQMLGNFEVLLEGLVSNPDVPVSLIPILTDKEKQQILVEWNQTDAPYPADLCAHQLFELQAARTPNANAIKFMGQIDGAAMEETWTYQELNQAGNRLAQRLRKSGVGPEILVGLCLPRSSQLVVSILAVLKAGGAYIPLDPSYPSERLSFMMADSQAAVLITHSSLISRFELSPSDPAEAGELGKPVILSLDLEWSLLDKLSGDNLDCITRPDNLAYVIYTSGSTGRPKGAMIEHRGLVNYLTWCQTAYPLEHGQGSPVHSSISFDLTITSLFSPLVSGKAVNILPEGLGVELLGATLRRDSEQSSMPYSLVKITPAHLQLLGEQLKPEQAPGRAHAFIIGGENLTPEHIRFWINNAPDTALVNEYGPTETVVGCCVYWAPPDSLDRFKGGVIPIGKPIINTQLYVLDSHLQPVPVGVHGELYIGGLGVGRGYLNRPELTAEKFLPDPFKSDPGARLYRTGDLVRYRPDGNLDCLGRIDFQVKVRGFRVELGEIEAGIAQYGWVKENVVWVWEEGGIKNLVAYLVIDPEFSGVDQQDLISEMRQSLQQKLPDYMVPVTFVILKSLPLTANGKVDRKALPKPDLSVVRTGLVLPRTPEEEIIANLWRDILHIDQLGIFDNFFNLGGHSLLATQVISRLRDAFGIELPLRSLFETPTVAGLAGQIDVARRSAMGVTAPPLQAIERDPETGLPVKPALLSYAQQRLWVLDQLSPNSPLYNIPIALQLTGPLDLEVLHSALQQLTLRHEILRTVFRSIAGVPRQFVLPELEIEIELHKVSGLPETQRLDQTRRIAMEAALRPFNLETGPLTRLCIIETSQDQHTILLNTHHIISDDWSLNIFMQELLIYYSDCQLDIEGPPVSPALMLRDLPFQYSDYAAWQRSWLQGEVLEGQLSYWKRQLAGLPPVVELPIDRPRPPVQTYSGGQVTFEISSELTARLKALTHQEGATLFMTLMSIFQVLLSRYTGQDEFAVGTPIANRTRSEVESLLGFFVNTLVIRSNLSGEPDFRQLLRRVRETALGAYAHQDVPFEMLVDALNPARDMSYHPLFQVMLVLQNAPQSYQGFTSDIRVEPVELYEGVARFDLTLTVVETPIVEAGVPNLTTLACSLEYNTDLFERSTIERLALHFAQLVNNILVDPDLPVTKIAMITSAERELILNQWSQSASELLSGQSVQELFTAQAMLTPDAPAVVYTLPALDENLTERVIESLTYAELDQRANLLSYYLQSRGVGPETIVGICVEKSLDMVVGLLGILKAGGAYLPLDPAYPLERLEFMLQDSQTPLLLTQQRLIERLPEAVSKADIQVVCLDQDWENIAMLAQGTQSSKSQVDGANLAYVIYTSGSTGKPKGVMLQHAGLTNLVEQQIKGFGISANDRVLQFASFSFDASISETFMALLSGACLVLTSQDVLGSLPDLLQVMEDQEVTVATIPPSLLRVIDPEIFTHRLPSFKTLISAGEACSVEIAQRWAPGRRMFNAYGPTEATIGPTYYPIKVGFDENDQLTLPGIPQNVSSIPIGRPISNMQVYVLDRNGQPVPQGVRGEICIGGIGLARGYLNRPDLTGEKFVLNPYSDTPGERIYRTGDLGCFLPDGNLVYLGRADHQVKLRGFRIELGEIESELSTHPGVRTSVVLVREDTPGIKRLVAYVVPEEGQFETHVSAEELKTHLHTRLPDYMIPAIFLFIKELPLTPNGKVDRKSLPAPEHELSGGTSPYIAPRNSNELILASIWAEVLLHKPTGDRPTISVEDNFFELGGDSILAIQVIARANEAGLALTPRHLFEAPTISGLAELSEAAQKTAAGQTATEAAQGSAPKEQSDQDEFGWSDEDFRDILGAIESSTDE